MDASHGGPGGRRGGQRRQAGRSLLRVRIIAGVERPPEENLRRRVPSRSHRAQLEETADRDGEGADARSAVDHADGDAACTHGERSRGDDADFDAAGVDPSRHGAEGNQVRRPRECQGRGAAERGDQGVSETHGTDETRGAKMVVYCRTKAECEGVAGELGCGYFYSGAAGNEEVLQWWKDHGGCVVATSALGTGVNYPGITAVVHVGMPYGLIDFAQESGRAGRGGEDVDSLVLVEKGWVARERATREARRQEWSRDEREMSNFVNADGCRRLVLAADFDEGEPVDCISGEMARCDRCGNGVTDWERTQKTEAREKGEVLDTLDEVASGCAACWVLAALGGSGDWLHDGGTCERRKRIRTADGEMMDMSEWTCDVFRKTIRHLGDSRTCFHCGVSQKLCNTREEGQGRCQWPRVAAPLVKMAMGCTMGRSIIRQAGYQGEMQDWEAYALWLGQTHRLRLWGEMASNSMVVIKEFLLYCRREMTDRLGGEKGSGYGWVNGELDAPGGAKSAAVEKPQARPMGEVIVVEELRRSVDEWREPCVLCRVHGRVRRVTDIGGSVAARHTNGRRWRRRWRCCAECDSRISLSATGAIDRRRSASFGNAR